MLKLIVKSLVPPEERGKMLECGYFLELPESIIICLILNYLLPDIPIEYD